MGSAACSPVTDGVRSTLRLGSSTGLGDRLEVVLRALAKQQPATETVLVSAPTRARLDRVASGQLDAAFVRGVTSAPGVELIEIWRDRQDSNPWPPPSEAMLPPSVESASNSSGASATARPPRCHLPALII